MRELIDYDQWLMKIDYTLRENESGQIIDGLSI